MGTCFMQAIYHLLTTSVEAYLGGAVTLPFSQTVYRIRTQVHYLFLGMGIVASTAAINNVITVEFLCRFCSAKQLHEAVFLCGELGGASSIIHRLYEHSGGLLPSP